MCGLKSYNKDNQIPYYDKYDNIHFRKAETNQIANEH